MRFGRIKSAFVLCAIKATLNLANDGLVWQNFKFNLRYVIPAALSAVDLLVHTTKAERT